MKIPGYVRGAALGLSAYFIASHLWVFALAVPQFYHRADFRQFYAGAYMMRTGERHSLYDFAEQQKIQNTVVSHESQAMALPFISPAYHAVLLAPLTLLPYRSAYIAFLLVNLALLALCVFLLWPYTANVRRVYVWLPVTICIGFYPIAWTLVHQQDSILLTAAIVGAFALLKKDREFAAGCLLACALFKFQIIIPIAIIFLLARRWKAVQGFSISAALLGVFSVWLTGIEQSKLYVQSLLSIASMTAKSGMSAHPVSWAGMPNLNGLATFILGTHTAPKAIAAVLSVALVWMIGKRSHKLPPQILVVAVPVAVLVGYHTYLYDLSPMILPILLCVNEGIEGEVHRDDRRWMLRAAMLMFMIPMIDAYPVPGCLTALGVIAVLSQVVKRRESLSPEVELVGLEAIA